MIAGSPIDMKSVPHYDAIVIGGGPGGSTAATFLARKGKRVLLLEKDIFPRFHIGESLLPYNRCIFEEMGVLPMLEAADFPRKLGAQFHLGNGKASLEFIFREGRFTKETEAFQVERAKFDHILLKHAQSSGADVREGWTVCKYSENPEGILVESLDNKGTKQIFQGSYLIDASGRSNLTGNQEGLRTIHPSLKKVAVFGHFTGVRLDQGEKGGDTIIVRLENKWFWLIPISSEKTSVGCVMDQSELVQAKKSPAELFEQIWRSSPPMVERMQRAVLVGSIQTTADFSYYNKRLVGEKLLRVGDAAGFMDPIFSAGVYLAMYSGKLAAETVDTVIADGRNKSDLFRRYEKRVFAGMKFYWNLVEHFYTKPFLEVFFNPRERFQIASAVNAALAGEFESRWALKWRMKLFFFIVKMQARRPLLPRLSFD